MTKEFKDKLIKSLLDQKDRLLEATEVHREIKTDLFRLMETCDHKTKSSIKEELLKIYKKVK